MLDTLSVDMVLTRPKKRIKPVSKWLRPHLNDFTYTQKHTHQQRRIQQAKLVDRAW